MLNLKNSTRLAVCSLSAALGVLMLFLGGITMVLAYAAPMFLGLLAIMLKRTFDTKSAWITYIATSILSFILVTDKECMMMYVIFFGYYPIVRDYFEKINKKYNLKNAEGIDQYIHDMREKMSRSANC